jgi:hypothetical protein
VERGWQLTVSSFWSSEVKPAASISEAIGRTTSRAGNRHFRLVSTLHAHSKTPIGNQFTLEKAKGA